MSTLPTLHLTTTSQRTDRPLPPRAVSALAMTMVLVSFLWLIAYTWRLLPAEGLGPWNYVASFGLLAGGAGLIELARTRR